MWTKFLPLAFATIISASRYGHGNGNWQSHGLGQGTGCDSVTQVDGCQSVGTISNVNGVDIYHSYPRGGRSGNRNDTKILLFVTDFYGVASINNRLLADHLARANYAVIMPDLFAGDPVPMTMREGTPALNLTDWRLRHTIESIDAVIESTIAYIKSDVPGHSDRLGAVGYCLGGKHVPRFMADGKGIDVGFIAHPSNLTQDEVKAVEGELSLATGQFDNQLTQPLRRDTVDTLEGKNATFELTLYSGAFHGFGVRPNVSMPQERFAKLAAYRQAVLWMDEWL